jgi:DNA-binding cell septation regulator SpoVG
VDDDITIHNFRVIKTPAGGYLVTPPMRESKNKNGNRKFTPLVQFSDGLRSDIEKAVLEAWRRDDV